MIKRMALLAIILILSLPVSAAAAEPDNGTIEGQVVNGTEGGSSVGNLEVTLKTYRNNAEVASATTRNDGEGRFAFKGLSTQPDYGYQITLTFQEAEYTSDWVTFDTGETSKFIEIAVYEATTSDEAIRVMTSHTIIYVGQGSLKVMEYYVVVNTSDRTYIGSELMADGRRKTLGFSLPKGATGIELGGELMECCIVQTEDGFIDTMPVLPGGKEIIYAYNVGYKSGLFTFTKKVTHPTVNYNLLVQGEGVKVTSDRLTQEEALNIEGSWFNHLSGIDLAPGDTLVTQLSGLPESGSGGAVKWVGLVLVILAGGFAFGYLRRKKPVQPVRVEDSLDQKRQRLLLELARLDDNFEGGKIPEEVYRKQRAAKKAQLARLMQRTKRG